MTELRSFKLAIAPDSSRGVGATPNEAIEALTVMVGQKPVLVRMFEVWSDGDFDIRAGGVAVKSGRVQELKLTNGEWAAA